MAALEAGDYPLVGAMMTRSHDGDRVAGATLTDAYLDGLAARDADIALECGAYGCSTPRIDALCDLLDATPGVLGSELVGAGLGGCVVALVEKSSAEAIIDTLRQRYYAPLGAEPRAFVYNAGPGSTVIW